MASSSSSHASSDQSPLQHVWTTTVGNVLTIPFSGNPGVKIAFDNETLEVGEIIDSLLFDNFWNILVEETNRYAHQILDTNQSRRQSRISDWIDTSVKEMKTFFGLLLHIWAHVLNRELKIIGRQILCSNLNFGRL